MELNENQNSEFNLDDIIHGKVQPHIYAFRTNTIPNYLKVGDTYRPVSVRLNEWKKYYKDLTPEYDREAVIDDKYFRDYSVHDFLEENKQKHRLTEAELKQIQNDLYYSKEFFEATTITDVKEAIENIIEDYKNNSGIYSFYSVYDKEVQDFKYERSQIEWEPRPNQKEVIENFSNALDKEQTNLLMFAVMRFGKSFTALCCAKEINAKLVLIVSAKADVKDEWKQNVEVPKNFEGFVFLESKDLQRNGFLSERLGNSKVKCVVVFLTLQDLQGSQLKEKHKELFSKKIDLMIIDESHFGARAQSYGQVIRNLKDDKDDESNAIDKVAEKLAKNDKDVEIDEADNQLKQIEKQLTVKIKLHLSGTPYRILMGSEFSKDNIIGFCQFSDIVNAQEEWNENNKDEDEWKNPYYGFPQMIRFAFNPNQAAQQKLQSLKQSGKSTSLSALFYPKSIEKDKEENYKKFVNEAEVLDLLKIIDGSKTDSNILSFLDYEKLKKGEMCSHMVMVLPYCASCDAMQNLIEQNKNTFKNLNSYNILNISGVNAEKKYKVTNSIKKAISEFAKQKQKTLTLTVNRMLTGTTVKEWDTMIFLKDSSSAQDYDQSIFRLQNQYISTFKNEDEKEIKFNNKPQTLLVDFDPNRMFIMQEQKSLIYNVNTEKGGNSKLKERIKEELRISPIITMNSGKITQIIPTDILQAVSQYSASRGVAEETNDIPVDANLQNFSEIFNEIERQNELGSKEGFTTKAASGEGTNYEDAESDESTPSKVSVQGESVYPKDDEKEEKDDIESFEKKFKTYYARILFFAYLTEDKIISLQELIKACEKNEENKRIIKNLDLKLDVLIAINNKIDKFILNQLDFKIQNINNLSTDENVAPLERALTALKKFGRLGTSEVVTPQNICDDMINLLPDECLINALNENHAIIDINSKTAEFAISLFKRYTQNLNKNVESIKNHIYSIPSSKITYEFTRKIYKILGLNIDCIANNFVSYDLLKVKNKDKIDYEKIANLLKQSKTFAQIKLTDKCTGENKMEFDSVVGNPPYQDMTGGQGSQATPLYHHFVLAAKKINPKYFSFIMPSRWFSGGFGLNAFRNEMLNDNRIKKIFDYPNSHSIFPNVDIPGGVCYLLWDKNNEEICEIINVDNQTKKSMKRSLNEYETFIRSNAAIKIVKKILEIEKPKQTLENTVSVQRPFGLPTNYKPLESGIPCYFIQKIGKKFAKTEDVIDSANLLNKWKLLVPKAPIAGQTDFTKPVGFYYDGNTRIAEPGSCCTESFIVAGAFNTEEEVKSFKSYLFTKIARFLLLQTVISQDVLRNKFCFVPALEKYDHIFTDKELCQRWNITEEEWLYIDSRIHNYGK